MALPPCMSERTLCVSVCVCLSAYVCLCVCVCLCVWRGITRCHWCAAKSFHESNFPRFFAIYLLLFCFVLFFGHCCLLFLLSFSLSLLLLVCRVLLGR